MSGQCYGCGAEFSRFKKEHGCKNCGFAFCNKCLNDKCIPIPKRGNAKHHVCHKCYNSLTGVAQPSTQEQKFDPPEAYLKRLAALKERESGPQPSRAPHPPGGGKVLPEHLLRLDKEDREIALRLEKLRAEDKPSEKVTDSDLRKRLAQLKGQNDIQEQKTVYQPPDRRPETQQVDDLIEQLIAEVDIDSLRPDPEQDVEARLAQFRQGDGGKTAIDKNNLSNTLDKRAVDNNDLNKVDKMGPIIRGQGHAGVNIHTGKAGTSTAIGDEEIDLEEVQRLMLQAGREVELDAKRALKGIQMDTELMGRLKQIQRQRADNVSVDSDTVDSDADNTAQSGNTAVSDDEDDESVSAQRLVQRYLDEVKIDAAVGGPSTLKSDKPSEVPSIDQKKSDGRKKTKNPSAHSSVEVKPSNLEPPQREDLVDSDYDDADELPYCCICTEDATIRCRDCEMDLYCQRCFKSCHEEISMTDHRTSPYKAPKGYR